MWQFYSNAQFGEDLLVTCVQGQEVSFFAVLINQLLGTYKDNILSMKFRLYLCQRKLSVPKIGCCIGLVYIILLEGACLSTPYPLKIISWFLPSIKVSA